MAPAWESLCRPWNSGFSVARADTRIAAILRAAKPSAACVAYPPPLPVLLAEAQADTEGRRVRLISFFRNCKMSQLGAQVCGCCCFCVSVVGTLLCEGRIYGQESPTPFPYALPRLLCYWVFTQRRALDGHALVAPTRLSSLQTA